MKKVINEGSVRPAMIDISAADKISRRTWLRKAVICTTAVAVPPALSATSLADAKASKSVVHYQNHPKAMMQMCGMCKFFVSAGGTRGDMGSEMMMEAGMIGRGMMGTGTCEVVAGRISPMGYCDLFAPRG